MPTAKAEMGISYGLLNVCPRMRVIFELHFALVQVGAIRSAELSSGLLFNFEGVARQGMIPRARSYGRFRAAGEPNRAGSCQYTALQFWTPRSAAWEASMLWV